MTSKFIIVSLIYLKTMAYPATAIVINANNSICANLPSLNIELGIDLSLIAMEKALRDFIFCLNCSILELLSRSFNASSSFCSSSVKSLNAIFYLY